jgi:hypothetical protein
MADYDGVLQDPRGDRLSGPCQPDVIDRAGALRDAKEAHAQGTHVPDVQDRNGNLYGPIGADGP